MSKPVPERKKEIVIGDSLLKGTEHPISRLDPLLREVCCLPGARVKDMTRKLPTLVRPADYYALLIFQVGSGEVTTRSLRAIKRDFRALEQLFKGSGAEAVFSIAPVAGNDEGGNRKSQQTNTCLQAWCHWWNFGVFDHGLIYTAPGLLVTDRVHLSQRGKRILAQELAGLID